MKPRHLLFSSFEIFRTIGFLLFLILSIYPQETRPEGTPFTVQISMEGGNLSRATTIFLLITFLSFLPMIILTMTSFLRISIVLTFLKQALGVQQAPSNQTVTTLSLFLTFFIMMPVWEDIYYRAIRPYTENRLTEQEAFQIGVMPLKKFMLRQTGEESLAMFMELAKLDPVEKIEDLPLRVVAPAFMLSELKVAFQMGFLIYLPFLVIDMVIATILMSMGMMMLPPMMVSIPFKILFFIMFDGWNLVVRSLILSFYGG